jgi:hypothetical protein
MKELRENFVRVQVNPERVVCLDNGDFHGWLFFRHPNGQLVTERKLKDWEIMQAEDQRDSGIVIDGGHNVISKSGGARCG